MKRAAAIRVCPPSLHLARWLGSSHSLPPNHPPPCTLFDTRALGHHSLSSRPRPVTWCRLCTSSRCSSVITTLSRERETEKGECVRGGGDTERGERGMGGPWVSQEWYVHMLGVEGGGTRERARSCACAGVRPCAFARGKLRAPVGTICRGSTGAMGRRAGECTTSEKAAAKSRIGAREC